MTTTLISIIIILIIIHKMSTIYLRNWTGMNCSYMSLSHAHYHSHTQTLTCSSSHKYHSAGPFVSTIAALYFPDVGVLDAQPSATWSPTPTRQYGSLTAAPSSERDGTSILNGKGIESLCLCNFWRCCPKKLVVRSAVFWNLVKDAQLMNKVRLQ